MIKALVSSIALAVISTTASAQLATQEPPVGAAGAVLKYSEEAVTLRSEDGKELVVRMTEGWTVSRARPLDSSAVKPGDFIASANRPVDEHTGNAVELRILEPGYRPEFGTHMMARAETAMTHGTVSSMNRTPAGLELEVTYPGGSRRIIVADSIGVTGYELLSRSVLAPGTKVRAVQRKDDEGVLRASRLTLEP